MKKLFERLFGVITPLVMLVSQGHASLDGKPDLPAAPDIEKITNISSIELVNEPSPLFLNQPTQANPDLLAGHRSHSSHRSHASHSSHASHYSGSGSSYTPSNIEPTKKVSPDTNQGTNSSIPTQSQRKDSNVSSNLPKNNTGDWKVSKEWIQDLGRLQQREVIIINQDGSQVSGIVTDTSNGALQVTKQGQATRFVNPKNVQMLLWR